MRIAQCSDTFLPIVDGVGRVVFQYATWLANAGHECYVITPFQDAGYRGRYPFEIVDFLGLKVPSAPQYETGIAILDTHYMERISSLTFDLVHVHAPGFAGVEAIRLSEKLKVPLVGTFHSKYYDDFLRATRSEVLASLGSRFVAEFYSRCDEVWTVSEDAAETLRSYGYSGPVSIVPNGSEKRTPSSRSKHAAMEAFGLDERPILLYVGQLDFKKNLRRTIEATALMQAHGHSVQLVLAGQGRDREKLEKLASQAGVQVIFPGHLVDRDLLDGLYMAADLFVFPSLYDTAGLVVQEAAAMATPSVVVRGTAPAESITDGVNGLLCEDTAESLCRVMEHYLFEMSPSDRRKLKNKARLTLPRPWDDIMEEVEGRYRALLASGQVKPKTLRHLTALGEKIKDIHFPDLPPRRTP